MRRTVLLALFLAFVAAAPAVTRAQSAETTLDEVRDAIQDRILEGFGTDLTKLERKCLKAFQRAETVLEERKLLRTQQLKDLKKVAKLLRKWFPAEEEVSRAARSTGDAYYAEFEALNGLIRDGIKDFERQKDVRKMEKLLARLEDKLRVAKGGIDFNGFMKAMFGASKVCDKALALNEKAPRKTPSTSSTIGGVLAAVSLPGAFRRLYSYDFTDEPGTPPTARPISAGTGDVEQFEVSRRGGGLSALYRRETDVVSRDLRDPNAAHVNLTAGLEPIRRFQLSPFEDCLILWAESNKVYAHRFDEGKAYEIGTGNGDALFGPDADRFLLTSLEANPVGRRVDLVEWDGFEYAQTPLAGPSVNGQDAGDVTISPDGAYFACTSIPQSAPGTRLMIGEFATGRSVQVHDSVIAMNSDQDISKTRTIACAWTGVREFLFAAPAGLMRGTFNADLTFPPPDVVDPGSRGFTVHANTPDVTVLHASTPGTLVLRYDSPTLGPVYRRVGEEGNTEISSILLADRYLAFAEGPRDEVLKVRLEDLQTGDEAVVATVKPEKSAVATTRVRGLKAWIGLSILGNGLLFGFNVASDDDKVGGIHVGEVGVGDDFGKALTPFEIMFPQEKETTVDDYGIGLVEDPDGLVQMLLASHRRDFTTGKTSLLGAGGTVSESGFDFSTVFTLADNFGSAGFTFWFR